MDKDKGDWNKTPISSSNIEEKNKLGTPSYSIYSRKRIRLPKIDFMYNNGNRTVGLENLTNAKKILKILLILFIAFSFLNMVIKTIEPILNQKCCVIAKSIATKVSNEEATKVMSGYTYEDLINISKDENGNIKFIGTNVITVNEIISNIPNKIQEELEKNDNSKFSISLGSFTGTPLLAGRGPKVNIKMDLAGSLDTNLKSEFKAAGINQTMHRIYLEIKCQMLILTPYNRIEEEITNQVLLAEGLIVGEIPSTYYNLEGMTRDNMIDIIE